MKITMLIVGIVAFVYSLIFTGNQTHNVSSAIKYMAVLIYSFFMIYLAGVM